MLGHVADPATKPADATSITVNGQAGWLTRQNGIITVTVPQADGVTAFFAGAGSTTQIEALAAIAFSHMDEVLAPLPH